MKKPIFIIVLAFMALAFNSMAQTTYTFTYDASGNRLSRTIQLKSGSITQNDTVAAKQTRFEDLIGNLPVKIYPNPTEVA